ncbi:hypothetical protein J4734_23030 [Klebsiella pneumoniae]|uniref:Uncharacterized protein n=1 Tax=Klebsiella pneumoniae TaxID=573 RepID=A0A939SUQ0_KLEPN|nr:hypothetical protein [Klebsiella pneumoniae]
MPQGKTFRPFLGTGMLRPLSPKGGGLGSAMVQGASQQLSLVISSVPVADASNPNAATSIKENVDIFGMGYNDGTWRFSALRITSGEYYFKDFTKELLKNQRH